MDSPCEGRPPPSLREPLEALVARYHSRRFVHPDPLEFLYDYPALEDREIAGLIASSLAYGRVLQILASVGRVLRRMGPAPFRFVVEGDRRAFRRTFRGFKHRFSTGAEIADLLCRARSAILRHGSLEACFAAGLERGDRAGSAALARFARELTGGVATSLIPRPESGSACKRLNLYLRWMVREDCVDPGGWTALAPRSLIVPLDTHLHRVARELGLTRRSQADMRTAIEVTDAFRAFSPDDPVRYDFALTRPGIRATSLRSARTPSILAESGPSPEART